jgi:hypothetical protein
MANPKDSMDDKHTFVRSYVRRKHIEQSDELPSEEDNSHKWVGWVLHLILIIVTGFFSFTHILKGGWRFSALLACIVLFFWFMKRIMFNTDE